MAVPNQSVLLDNFCQHTFPLYEHLMQVYETPKIQTREDWAAASKLLREAFDRTISEIYPMLSAKLKRSKEHGNRLVAYDVGSCHPILSFEEISDWAPRREDIATQYLDGWPVSTRLQAMPLEVPPYILRAEEHVSMFVKFTWVHQDSRSFVMIYYNRGHILMDGGAHAPFRLHFARVHREMVAERQGDAEYTNSLKEIPKPPMPTFNHKSFGRKDAKLPKGYAPRDCAVFLNISLVFPFIQLQRFFRRKTPQCLIIRVRFPKSTLENMQRELLEYNGKTADGKPLSKNDVLMAFWMKTTYTLTKQKSAVQTVPINLRGKFPGLDENHVGSTLAHGFIHLEKCAQRISLGDMAVKVHDAVREAASVEGIQKRCDWEVQRKKVTHGFYLGAEPGKFTFCSSWRHFPMYDLNNTFGGLMGEGVPLVVAPCNLDHGTQIFLPPPPNQGLSEDMIQGTDAFYCLPEKNPSRQPQQRDEVIKLLPSGSVYVGCAQRLKWL